MQDDQRQAPLDARQKSGRHFELPRAVREVGPDSGRVPDDAETAGSSASTLAGTEGPWSKPETASSGPEPNGELSDTFARRWEQVQTRFVDQVVRGSRGRRRMPRRGPVAAAALELVKSESITRLPPRTARRSRVAS